MEMESMIPPLKGPYTEQEEHGHAQTNCLEHKAINAESYYYKQQELQTVFLQKLNTMF